MRRKSVCRIGARVYPKLNETGMNAATSSVVPIGNPKLDRILTEDHKESSATPPRRVHSVEPEPAAHPLGRQLLLARLLHNVYRCALLQTFRNNRPDRIAFWRLHAN